MREKIKLESSAGTGHFYTTTKNKRTTPDKIEIRKYDPKARKHVIYKETLDEFYSWRGRSCMLKCRSEHKRAPLNGHIQQHN